MYGIPLSDGIASGPLWDPAGHEWRQDYVSLPRTPSGKLILTPKAIVRSRMGYDLNEYYNDYILSELILQELNANSSLVQLLKCGRTRVTKKSVREKYGQSKALVIKETVKKPELLEKYRADKREEKHPPPRSPKSCCY